MKKIVKLLSLVLVLSLALTCVALPAAADEISELDPCAVVGPGHCVHCGSANVTYNGLQYDNIGSGDCDGGYNHTYVYRVYLCNSCGLTSYIYDHFICAGNIH